MAELFKLRFVGLSHDLRTNKWEAKCKCGKSFNPPTTTLSTQTIECPKCGKTELVNYNEIEY